MRFEKVRDGWNRLGSIDPMWAILTNAEKLGNRWDEDEFFATGKQEVEGALALVAATIGSVPEGTALDFGCGIGRLSRALCEHFAQVVGVDVAATMIERAQARNRYPERCNFVLNEHADLAIFDNDSFDFIYSSITLQHIEPLQAKRYLAEFSRILKVGGILLFQIPLPMPVSPRFLLDRIIIAAQRLAPLRLLTAYRKIKYRRFGDSFMQDAPKVLMEMHGLTLRAIKASFTSHKMLCLDARRREDAGSGWKTFTYIFMRLGSVASAR